MTDQRRLICKQDKDFLQVMKKGQILATGQSAPMTCCRLIVAEYAVRALVMHCNGPLIFAYQSLFNGQVRDVLGNKAIRALMYSLNEQDYERASAMGYLDIPRRAYKTYKQWGDRYEEMISRALPTLKVERPTYEWWSNIIVDFRGERVKTHSEKIDDESEIGKMELQTIFTNHYSIGERIRLLLAKWC